MCCRNLPSLVWTCLQECEMAHKHRADGEDAWSDLRTTPVLPMGNPFVAPGSLMTQLLGLGLLCPPQVPVFKIKSSGDHILGFCAGEASGCIETGNICMLLQPCPLCSYLEDCTNANECCFKYSSGQLYWPQCKVDFPPDSVSPGSQRNSVKSVTS